MLDHSQTQTSYDAMGPVIAEFRGLKTEPIVLLLGFGSAALLISTPFWMPSPDFQGPIYWLLLMPALGMLCLLWLSVVALRRKMRSLVLRQHGFVCKELGSLRWSAYSQVVGYSFDVTCVTHGMVRYNQGQVRLDLVRGNPIRISPEFEEIEQLGAGLSEQVATYVIQNVVGTLKQGNEVGAGPFTLTPRGIRRKKLEIPYQDIQRVREEMDFGHDRKRYTMVIRGSGKKSREIRVRANKVTNRPFIESIVCAMKPPDRRKHLVETGEMFEQLQELEHQIGLAIRRHMTPNWQEAELRAELPAPGAFSLSMLMLRDPTTGLSAPATEDLIAAATNYLALHSQYRTGADRIVVKMFPAKRGGGWNLEMNESIQANDSL